MSNFRELKECVACGADESHLHTYLDLGTQPLANSNLLHPEEQENEYPLAVNYCDVCWHNQLTISVDPAIMFQDYDYVSGTSDSLKYHFDQCARLVSKCMGHIEHGRILDIASNDGTFLKIMKTYNWHTTGVDPAENLAEEARGNADEIVVGYFNEQLGKEFAAQGKRFHVIMAQNVVAHVPDPLNLLLGCRHALQPGGRIFIQTSQCDMVPKGQFDAIYHEHISYFSAKSMRHLAARANLFIESVYIEPIHGNSYMFVLKLPENGHDRHSVSLCKREMFEENEGRYREHLYHQMAKNASDIMCQLAETIEIKHANGFKVVGFGAAAKGNTLLNATQLAYGKLNIEYIVDENPRKMGKFTPGSHIPIKSPLHLYSDSAEKIAVVLFAWNFAGEIIKRVCDNAKSPQVIFIKPKFATYGE